MKATHSLSITLAAICLASFSLHAQDGWVNLFNGQNLDGWEEHSGQANYSVQDGVLTGQSVSGTGNSFLCTERHRQRSRRFRLPSRPGRGAQFRRADSQ